MTDDQTRALLTTPLGKLEPDVATELMSQILTAARKLGLKVGDLVDPEIWAEALEDQTFAQLRASVIALSKRTKIPFLNVPADLLAGMPDRDAESWAKVEARLNTGNRELAPILDGREMLAILDDQGIAWDFTHANHPIEREKVKQRYLAALRRDRTHDPRIARLVQARVEAGIPHALAVEQVLAGPGLVVREEQVSPGQRQIEAALGTMCLAMTPARA